MTDAAAARPTLATAIQTFNGKWGWFVALGISELVLGGIASANLMAANFASILVIGVTMAAAGIIQIVHALSAREPRGFLFLLFAGIVYAAAGALILYDPVLASLTLSLTTGIFLAVGGVTRVLAAVHARPGAGWRWIAATGVLTFCVGVMTVALWPTIGLWLLGAILTVDLIFQGWGLIAFGLALKARASRNSR